MKNVASLAENHLTSEESTPSESIAELIRRIQPQHALARQNIAAVQFIEKGFSENLAAEDFTVASYLRGEQIVHSGHLIGELQNKTNLTYACVPLGLVISGEVTVVKGGKATKNLSPGDFVGLFETSDWLLCNRKKEIGDWTLIANRDAEILFFNAEFFSKENHFTKVFSLYLIELSRRDPVPQPITALPILDWVAQHTTGPRLHEYAIIAHTHLLPNNVPFFRQLSHLVKLGRIYVLEKPYSTVPRAHAELVHSGIEVVKVRMEPDMPYEYAAKKSLDILWSKVIEDQKKMGFTKLLVVDDGGDLWLSLPWHALKGVSVAGVEQTQRGITRIQNSSIKLPPIVSVAGCAVKKIVESEFIGTSIVKKLNQLELVNSRQRIGILGLGHIGSAAFNELRKGGHRPLCYDPTFHNDPEAPEDSRPSMDTLINDCDIVIGTTGTDALKGVALERLSGNKIFVSASSADVEFASLLSLAEPNSDAFATRNIQVHSHFTIQLLNGGYPMNFDRKENATPNEDIVLTRSLMYVGAMQAIKLIEENNLDHAIYAIDHEAQRQLMEKWVDHKKELGQEVPKTVHNISELLAKGSPGQTAMPSIWKKKV